MYISSDHDLYLPCLPNLVLQCPKNFTGKSRVVKIFIFIVHYPRINNASNIAPEIFTSSSWFESRKL